MSECPSINPRTGRQEQRNWRNGPGPFYAGEPDSLAIGTPERWRGNLSRIAAAMEGDAHQERIAHVVCYTSEID